MKKSYDLLQYITNSDCILLLYKLLPRVLVHLTNQNPNNRLCSKTKITNKMDNAKWNICSYFEVRIDRQSIIYTKSFRKSIFCLIRKTVTTCYYQNSIETIKSEIYICLLSPKYHLLYEINLWNGFSPLKNCNERTNALYLFCFDIYQEKRFCFEHILLISSKGLGTSCSNNLLVPFLEVIQHVMRNK